jgi:hypothetical protein
MSQNDKLSATLSFCKIQDVNNKNPELERRRRGNIQSMFFSDFAVSPEIYVSSLPK